MCIGKDKRIMTKIVYVTGCLGFIGYHVTKKCLDKGYHVFGIDKKTYASNLNLLPSLKAYPKFKFLEIDINDIERLHDCDYFINTAAETHVDNSIVSSDVFLKSNINGVHKILELIKARENSRRPILLHFSTDEVYGDIVDGFHSETDLLKPSNPYSATKAAADMLVTAWARTYDVPYVIIRPTNNYGIGQYVEKLIPKSCKFLSLGRKIPLHNNGTPIRNWLHAKDTAQGVITIIESGVKNEIFNIAGGFEQSNIDTVKKIIKEFFGECNDSLLEKHLDLRFKRDGQDVRYAINDDKLKNLGWKPNCQFDEEIKDIIQHYKNNFIW
jgi:dTDP-glucose 4,6-dehydratase